MDVIAAGRRFSSDLRRPHPCPLQQWLIRARLNKELNVKNILITIVAALAVLVPSSAHANSVSVPAPVAETKMSEKDDSLRAIIARNLTASLEKAKKAGTMTRKERVVKAPAEVTMRTNAQDVKNDQRASKVTVIEF